MKSRFILLAVTIASAMVAGVSAQTSTDPKPIVASDVTVSAPAATNAPAAVEPAPAPAAVAPAPAPAPVAPAPAPQPASPSTNGFPSAPVTNTPAMQDSAISMVHDSAAPIPLIVMDEVPLTDAIKNLARQASLNYMLDPKINYNTPDASGNVRVQPMVSLRWENVTADQALAALLNNYNLKSEEDPKTHISRITVKDPAAAEPLVTKIIQLKYSDATNIIASVETVLLDKRSKVIADVRTSQLVLVATEKEVRDVETMINRLDLATKEVLIEAKLIELSKSPSTSKGIDWTGTLGKQNFSFGNNVLSGQSGNPYSGANSLTTNILGQLVNYAPNNAVATPRLLVDSRNGIDPQTMFLNADGVSAALSFLNTETGAKVLSTPRAVTLDNREATLSIVTATPIIQQTAGTQGSPGGSSITYTNLGTILHVTPRISANNTIALKVVPEVSDDGGQVSQSIQGITTTADIYNIRRIETQVLIPSGHTLVMGGLINDNITTGNTKVPLLGDIPLLGYLFRQDTKSQKKSNLIIFVTPTIVQDEDFQVNDTKFLKTKIPENKGANFGAWDRGKPQDWSKLFGSKKPTDEDKDEADMPTTN